jgi:hypothetical protein
MIWLVLVLGICLVKEAVSCREDRLCDLEEIWVALCFGMVHYAYVRVNRAEIRPYSRFAMQWSNDRVWGFTVVVG